LGAKRKKKKIKREKGSFYSARSLHPTPKKEKEREKKKKKGKFPTTSVCEHLKGRRGGKGRGGESSGRLSLFLLPYRHRKGEEKKEKKKEKKTLQDPSSTMGTQGEKKKKGKE